MGAKNRRAIASQLIVVDADVLRGASSTDGGPPAGARCRRALQDILTICHRAVVSPDLENEYNRHASNYGMRWRAAMAHRGKLVPTPATETGRARGWKQSKHFTTTERAVVDKDLHLVLAAWETKAVVLSGDDRVRGLFARLPDLADLGWARIADDDLYNWLRNGAPADSMALGE
ncbi:MAG TPA: hypothetical protein VFK02_32165 [Kofleriaceae bacterium]|nr:hypothetical protein [Kofleriaceae bacterium]